MNKNVRIITYTAIAAAIVFVVTRIIPLPIGSTGAYINLGDISIYFVAFLLGGPLAAVAAAIGSALADITTASAAIYAPATFIIKGLMALAAGALMKSGKFPFYVVACICGGAIMTAGYAVFETFLFTFPVAVANIPFNLIQWGGSVVIALILYPIAVRIKKVTQLGGQQ